MYEDFKVIAVTPAGRKRYMDILLRYITSQRPLIDEWRLWVNTTNEDDVAWMRTQQERFPEFIHLDHSKIPINPNAVYLTAYQFFKHCTESKTIYIRFDDDICYIHPEAIKELCRYRVQHPEHLLVFANTINNSICNHIHQRIGAMPTHHGIVGYSCLDEIGWKDPRFAISTHENFFNKFDSNQLNDYMFPQWIMWESERVSINCISWLGEDFAKFGGIVHPEEEECLTVTYPSFMKRTLAIAGKALVSHYAYFTQREEVDKHSHILDWYKSKSNS